jgi:hypothetical protein
MTNPGLVRRENQNQGERISSAYGEAFIVTDGMVWRHGGASAEMMTVHGVREYLSANCHKSLPAAR